MKELSRRHGLLSGSWQLIAKCWRPLNDFIQAGYVSSTLTFCFQRSKVLKFTFTTRLLAPFLQCSWLWTGYEALNPLQNALKYFLSFSTRCVRWRLSKLSDFFSYSWPFLFILNHDVLARCNHVMDFLLSFWYRWGFSEMCDFSYFLTDFDLDLKLHQSSYFGFRSQRSSNDRKH